MIPSTSNIIIIAIITTPKLPLMIDVHVQYVYVSVDSMKLKLCKIQSLCRVQTNEQKEPTLITFYNK